MDVSDGRSLPAMIAILVTVERNIALPMDIKAPFSLYLQEVNYVIYIKLVSFGWARNMF